VVKLLIALLLLPTPAWALPITASVEGCVTDLNPGEASWVSPEYFQFVAFWDPVAGCDPTILSPGVFYVYEQNFDGLGGSLVTAMPEWFPVCGRIQFDAQEYIDTPNGAMALGQLKSLVYNTGTDCESYSEGSGDGGDAAGVPEPAILILLAGGAASAVRRRRRAMVQNGREVLSPLAGRPVRRLPKHPQ
jgi:hypothetical protein